MQIGKLLLREVKPRPQGPRLLNGGARSRAQISINQDLFPIMLYCACLGSDGETEAKRWGGACTTSQ